EGQRADPVVLAKLSLHFCEQRHVFPVSLRDQGKTLVMAMTDPTDLSIIDEAMGLARCRIQPALAGEAEIERAIARHYKHTEPPPAKTRARGAVERSQRTPGTPGSDLPAYDAAASAGGVPFRHNEMEFDPQALEETLPPGTKEASWDPGDLKKLRALSEN